MESVKTFPLFRCKNELFLFIILCVSILSFFNLSSSEAKTVSAPDVMNVVRGWLKMDPKPLGTSLGKEIARVESFTDEHGQVLYYVVYLDPKGFVIISGDDMVEPIIAFVEEGIYNPSTEHPLGALVSGDIPSRLAAVRELREVKSGAGTNTLKSEQRAALEKACQRARSKWAQLASADENIGIEGLSSVSEIWVAPLTQSTWGQGNVEGYSNTPACYNYYTPPGPPGSSTNYPCGCVATSMVQLMRYHEYATGGYVWSNMPLQPHLNTGLTERQAIGQFCFDAAEDVDTTYGPGGSSASLEDASQGLRGTFGYNNSIFIYNSGGVSSLNEMTNPNLDANHPVILGITGPSGGHAVISDGYGYNALTLYHHINMGWDGRENAWYNLPTVDSSPYSFNKVNACVFNVFITGSGEIISGRVTEPDGKPLEGVTVTATGSGTYEAASNENGIYALAKVPSGTSFTLTAEKGAWTFSGQAANTGTSSDSPSPAVGNVWGKNFTGSISAGYIEFDKESYIVPETLELRLVDTDLLGNGSQNILLRICGGDLETLSLSETPAGSGVFTGSISAAQGAPSQENGTLQLTQGEIIYALYEDADDGTGNSATAKDKASASVGLRTTVYDTNFTGGLPGGWSIVDGGAYLNDSWTSLNPGTRVNGNWTGTFMIVDSDYWGIGLMDEQLITHNIDCSGFENVKLTFKHYFQYWYLGLYEICDVDVRVNAGSWQNVTRFEGAHASGTVELPLSAYGADDSTNVQIRWHYYNADWEYYWGIDDVEISGFSIPVELLGDFEMDCDVDLRDFAILSLAWMSGPGDGNWEPMCDISEPSDNFIDNSDLKVFTQNWLVGVVP